MAVQFRYDYAESGLISRNLSVSEYIYSLYQSAIYSCTPQVESGQSAL